VKALALLILSAAALPAADSPREIAELLARYYGHDFDQPVYIPAMALIGQLRLGNLESVRNLAAPYIDGRRDSLANATPSHLAGHLIFAELAESTHDPRYLARLLAAADLKFSAWDDMSDAVFMGCPLYAAAGNPGRALRLLRDMQKLCLRPDGIYRHSPLTDAAWGRGNAFPALGLALALPHIPKEDQAYAPILVSFQRHVKELLKFQTADGMWREVIDQPQSYEEFSATAMIATSMVRGIRYGWLDRYTYQPSIDKAWVALTARISATGELTGVCESTGKQKSLEDYLHRKAINGRDARGGGMALLLATELCCMPGGTDKPAR
jgi:unsaturated rhamnogalacturonyl hydrolase